MKKYNLSKQGLLAIQRTQKGRKHLPQEGFQEGNKFAEIHKGRIPFWIIGEKNNNWKGNKVGYRALHYWVYTWLGKPKICEFCGKEYIAPKSIHWANKSGKYLRDLSDWISLCPSCHKEYDKQMAY